jgi:hypothetical protein
MSPGVLILHCAPDGVRERIVPKFVVQNYTDKTLDLAIEPWVDLEKMEPAGQVTFENDEPSEISIVFRNDGSGSVFVLAYNVKISANGTETIYRMPAGFSIENFPMGER